jgi:hypothetical protein
VALEQLALELNKQPLLVGSYQDTKNSPKLLPLAVLIQHKLEGSSPSSFYGLEGTARPAFKLGLFSQT